MQILCLFTEINHDAYGDRHDILLSFVLHIEGRCNNSLSQDLSSMGTPQMLWDIVSKLKIGTLPVIQMSKCDEDHADGHIMSCYYSTGLSCNRKRPRECTTTGKKLEMLYSRSM
jgi:hypothetical protein